MSMSRKTYWAVPVIVAVAIGGFVAYSGQASAEPPLPALTAQQLIANVASAQTPAFSGNLSVTTDIGLPDLSSLQNLFGSQMNIGGLTSLLAGTTNVKVAVDPATGARAEIDSGTSAYVAVANLANDDGWVYLSASNSATHLTGLAGASSGEDGESPAQTVPTPQNIADQLINVMSPSTTISVADNTTVAGRPAYTLDLTPKDSGSLISAVDIMIDANSWMPLGVRIWSTQLAGQAALDVSFTALSYATPSASLFNFTAPADATVQTVDLGQDAAGQSRGDSSDDTAPAPSATTVAGEGWASVTELTNLPASITSALDDPAQLAGLLTGAANGTGGGHGNHGSLNTMDQLIGSIAQQTPQGMVYSTYLGSLLVTPSGHVFVGAVPASALEAAAQANQ